MLYILLGDKLAKMEWGLHIVCVYMGMQCMPKHLYIIHMLRRQTQ